MASEIILTPIKQEPQAVGSAITYARRYALSAMLGIVADDDDDAEAAMGRGKQQPPVQAPAGAPAATGEHLCPIHKVPMEQHSNKAGNQHWYSHKVGDEWCSGIAKTTPAPTTAGTPAPASPDPEKEISWDGKKAEPEPKMAGFVNMDIIIPMLQQLQVKKHKAWYNSQIVADLNALTMKQAKTVTEAVAALSKEQAGAFVKKVQEAAEMA